MVLYVPAKFGLAAGWTKMAQIHARVWANCCCGSLVSYGSAHCSPSSSSSSSSSSSLFAHKTPL